MDLASLAIFRTVARELSITRAAQQLALQLQLPFEVGFLSGGLMASAPDGPGDDESRFDAALDHTKFRKY